MTGGDFLAESLFLTGPAGQASVPEFCDFFRLGRGKFARMLSRYPEIAARKELFARQRNGGGSTFS